MTYRIIPANEIVFEPASMIDDTGRVFWWQGEIYRAIRHERVAFFQSLITDHKVKDLMVNGGLVHTEIAPFQIDGYGLVLRHQQVPVRSYCVEWGPRMLRDAALLICDLSLQLLEQGLILTDAHPWNVLFDSSVPTFVDWGSISRLEGSGPWPYSEFRDRFVFPLLLMASGQSRIARLLMLDTVNRQPRRVFYKLLLKEVAPHILVGQWWRDRKLQVSAARPSREFFLGLRQWVESIPIRGLTTEWTNYQGPDMRNSDVRQIRIVNIENILRELRPKTVLDIGCNKGWFSELAVSHGARVIAADVDEPSIDILYSRVQSKGFPILPLLLDVCSPTPQHGLAGAYAPAHERLKADLVMVLAVTHHLVFKRGLTFEAIARVLSAFSNHQLLVEFVPADDRYVKEWMSERYSWYTLDGFLTALRAYFPHIEILESSPTPRLLLFCKR